MHGNCNIKFMLRALTSSPKIVIALGTVPPILPNSFARIFQFRSGEIQLNLDLKLLLKLYYLFFMCGIPLYQWHELVISFASPRLTYTH